MVWEKEKSTFKYLLCGILRLHSMCDLASRVPKIEQYQEVALALTAYYKVYICKEAAFAAVCVDVKYLRTNDSSRSVSPTTEETLNHLGCSVILLFNFYSLCVSKSYFGNALLTNRLFISQFESRIVRAASEDNLFHELGKRWIAGATSFLCWTRP
ncbi:uncharacterized protein LOC121789710 isoform X2 [Salvia splendens]|uniref:uncharacterized protein LOC121762537 isoform X2 n=1 Tax=Salvia splendens TaxID=180675 RepID=UPI001C2761B9|nr:uncharacterized protein LOC121762537 isoform X2 [Salvia splendens]XP_042044029.1 uncharacterized protein LOC121789710 isoform X2 [Salvia splendens]